MSKLIIFDCDGVLIDSEIISNQVDAQMLTSFGYPVSTEESIKKFIGLNAKTVRQIILQESGLIIPENLSEVTSQAIMDALEKSLQPLMESVLEHPILTNLSKCVASSSPKERVLKSLQITKQNHFFRDEHIFTSTQVKNGKPAPDLFLFAADQIGFKTKDCLVIEDSIAGIEAARSAQMSVIAFLGGSHAKYAWYKKRIQDQTSSVANNTTELLNLIKCFINNGCLL